MNTTAQLSGALQDAFDIPTHGVIGLVDDLLRLCPKEGLQLVWQSGHCRVISVANNSEDVFELPLPKSVFRAILARVAELCKDQNADSVSPYGGQSRFVVAADPPRTLKVTFMNTTDEQELELVPETVNRDKSE